MYRSTHTSLNYQAIFCLPVEWQIMARKFSYCVEMSHLIFTVVQYKVLEFSHVLNLVPVQSALF